MKTIKGINMNENKKEKIMRKIKNLKIIDKIKEIKNNFEIKLFEKK
jgi:hypothetical protein